MKPPDLPMMTFILSDWENRILACDIAKELENYDPSAVSWDFEAPSHEALASLIDIDFGTDLGDPRQLASPDQRDKLVAMIKFVEENFGVDYFGNKAFEECSDQRSFRSDPIIFRDATWQHIKPFLAEFKPHEVVITDLKSRGYVNPMPISLDEYKMFSSRILLFAKPTVESVVAAIKELG